MLSQEEKTRYMRQILLNDWGEVSQEKIKSTTVFVAGAGGSGSPILTQLALLGFGKIRVCDFDSVELSNLNRQFIHAVSDDSRIGVNKAVSAAKTISNINPNVKVDIIQERIDENNVDEIIGDADILFDSVDHIPTKFILSTAALRREIPHLFYGMMDINSFFMTFNPPNTPCFHCLYDYSKLTALQSVATKIVSVRKKVTPNHCPTLFLSTGFAVNEALKILFDIGDPAYNIFYLFLQKRNGKIKDSNGFLGMLYWVSDYFRSESLKQGYDWDKGWCHNTIEQLNVKRDPSCKNCGHI